MCIDYFATATRRLALAVHKALNTHKNALVSENIHLQDWGLDVLYLRVLDEGWLGSGHEAVVLGPIIEIWGWSSDCCKYWHRAIVAAACIWAW